jgi:hypothetical protein
LSILTTGIDDERRARIAHSTMELATRTEITKKREFAEIENTSERHKFRRKTIYKLVATVLTALGALVAAYAAGVSGVGP